MSYQRDVYVKQCMQYNSCSIVVLLEVSPTSMRRNLRKSVCSSSCRNLQRVRSRGASCTATPSCCARCDGSHKYAAMLTIVYFPDMTLMMCECGGQENARSLPVTKQSLRWHRSRSTANQALACAGVRGAGVDRAT